MGLSLWNIFKVCVVCACRLSHESSKFNDRSWPQNLYLSYLLTYLLTYLVLIVYSPLYLQAGLLVTNSAMILNRKRFLAKYGLDDLTTMGGHAASPMQTQMVGLLHAVQYLKVPVIACNIITIFIELLFGGA